MAKPTTVDQYLAALPPDRREVLQTIRKAVNAKLPKGFEEGILYGMIGWYVPFSRFPQGYHCDPTKPLMLAALASQKQYVSFYMPYFDEKATERFQKAWAKTGKKLDMGKSCVRFKKLEDIPLELIVDTLAGIPVDGYLELYLKLRADHAAGKAAKKKPAAEKPAKKAPAKRARA